jgi:hypothetical protein
MKLTVTVVGAVVSFEAVDGEEIMVWDSTAGELFFEEADNSFTKVATADARTPLREIAEHVRTYVAWRRAGGRGRSPKPQPNPQRASARR